MSVELSIVIPVLNRLDLTKQCLASLAASPPEVAFEVVVVDNGSTDGTAQWLASQDAIPVRVLRHAANLGFAKGCNSGVAVSSGRLVCLLNNDVEVASGFADRHVEVLDADRDVGVVGSRLHYPDGRIQHAGVLLCDDRRVGDPFVAIHRFHGRPGDFAPAHEPMAYRAVTAALLTMRRKEWEELGGLDEGYWNGYEDVDLCLRVGASGRKVVYEPRSHAIHHESASGPERWTRVAENVDRLHTRWRGRVPVDVVIHADGTPEPTTDAGFGPYVRPA